jgi:hypothetical protein
MNFAQNDPNFDSVIRSVLPGFPLARRGPTRRSNTELPHLLSANIDGISAAEGQFCDPKSLDNAAVR